MFIEKRLPSFHRDHTASTESAEAFWPAAATLPCARRAVTRTEEGAEKLLAATLAEAETDDEEVINADEEPTETEAATALATPDVAKRVRRLESITMKRNGKE